MYSIHLTDSGYIVMDESGNIPMKIDIAKSFNFMQDRAEAAEARAADLQARLDAMKSEYDAATDEWYTRIERAAQLESEIKYLRSTDHAADIAMSEYTDSDTESIEAERDELAIKYNNLLVDHETTLTRLHSAEQGLANMIHEYDKAMQRLSHYEKVTA